MRFGLSFPFVIVCVLMSPMILLACASTILSSAPEGRAAFCDVAEPIFWSPMDTDETLAAVKEHNAVGVKLCGWAA